MSMPLPPAAPKRPASVPSAGHSQLSTGAFAAGARSRGRRCDRRRLDRSGRSRRHRAGARYLRPVGLGIRQQHRLRFAQHGRPCQRARARCGFVVERLDFDRTRRRRQPQHLADQNAVGRLELVPDGDLAVIEAVGKGDGIQRVAALHGMQAIGGRRDLRRDGTRRLGLDSSARRGSIAHRRRPGRGAGSKPQQHAQPGDSCEPSGSRLITPPPAAGERISPLRADAR